MAIFANKRNGPDLVKLRPVSLQQTISHFVYCLMLP